MKATEQFAKTMRERELSELIRDACNRLKLRAYHTHDSRRSDRGWPDLVIAGRDRVIFRELKTETGRLSVDQVLWIEDLTRCGLHADVWKPSQWFSGQIMRELHALAQGSPDGPGGTGVTPSGVSPAQDPVHSRRLGSSWEGSTFEASAIRPLPVVGGAP